MLNERRVFAISKESFQAYELLPLSKLNMDELFDTPRIHNIIGFPAYYDEDGRVWPIPFEGCIVAKQI